MARTFDGANDSIHTSPGALASMTFGTFAIVCRRNSTAYNNLMTLHTSGGVSRLGLEIESTGDGNNLQWQYDGSFVASTFTIVNADGWVLLAMGKATGTTTPRCHKYVYSTNTWTHQDAAGTATNSTAVGGTGTMRFGEWEGSDDLNGDIAVAAAWSGRNLTDTEVEQLAHSLQGWCALAPDALWLFDQAAVSQNLLDLTGGGANQSAITGTAVSTASPPISYGDETIVPHSVPSAGGPINVNIGQAAETDTATSFGRSKAKAAGQASETDTSATFARAKARTFGPATETDTATTSGRAKAKTFSLASETDTATAFGRTKSRAFGQPTETSTATATGRAKAKATGQAVETNTGQTISPTAAIVVNVGQAQEADTATPVARAKRKAIGQPAETDTAAAFTASDALIVGQALETDVGQPFGRIKRITLGQALESATVGLMAAVKSRTLGQATEAGTAGAFGRRKARTLGQATEIEAALSVAPPDSGIIFRPNTGTTARPATGTITRPNTGTILRP
jgi:hypothetical protein